MSRQAHTHEAREPAQRAAAARPTVALVAHGVHDRGGMERACAELIRRAGGRFAFVVVAADVDPAIRALAERCIEVRIPKRPMPLRFVAFSMKAGWALRRVRADLVHTVGAIVPNRADLASVHFCHAGYREVVGFAGPPQPSLTRRASGALARWVARRAERWCYRPARLRALAAVSQGVAGEAARHFPDLPVTVTSNGVDAQRFHPSPATRAQVRAETSTGETEVVALFLGGDWRRKGLELAIGGLAVACSAGAKLRLWVVGPGDEQAFRQVAKRAGVDERVTFFGPRDDTARFYQGADLFVLPSAYETFSIASFEAAVCGLPLVIPRLHGAGELVGDNEGGIVVERTAESVGQALLRLAGDDALRARLGTEAQRRASGYSWQRSVDSVASVYETLLVGAPRAPAGPPGGGRPTGSSPRGNDGHAEDEAGTGARVSVGRERATGKARAGRDAKGDRGHEWETAPRAGTGDDGDRTRKGRTAGGSRGGGPLAGEPRTGVEDHADRERERRAGEPTDDGDAPVRLHGERMPVPDGGGHGHLPA